MPLEYRIDRDRRVVFATATRTLSDQEIFAYQREVWSDEGLTGYDEVVDLGPVEDLVVSSGDRVRAFAELASAMDVPGVRSRLVIVAPSDLTYGFARMFETYRGMSRSRQKTVSVFRSMQAALDWLAAPVQGGAGTEP